MRKLSSIFVALTLLATTSVFAIEKPIADNTDTKAEFTRFLQNPDFLVTHDMEAKVLFTLNKDNEIVILSVETDSPEIEGYVKDRLYLKKLNTKLEQGKQYVVPVKIKSEK